MMAMLTRLLREERGEDLIEYGLLAAFAATVVLTVLAVGPHSLKAAVVDGFKRCVDTLEKAH